MAWCMWICPRPARPGPACSRAAEFEIGSGAGLTLPQTAVQLRDGFSYVLRVGADSKVMETKVRTGRRIGDRVEISEGLTADAKVVAAGGGFLADGDTVRVVEGAKP